MNEVQTKRSRLPLTETLRGKPTPWQIIKYHSKQIQLPQRIDHTFLPIFKNALKIQGVLLASQCDTSWSPSVWCCSSEYMSLVLVNVSCVWKAAHGLPNAYIDPSEIRGSPTLIHVQLIKSTCYAGSRPRPSPHLKASSSLAPSLRPALVTYTWFVQIRPTSCARAGLPYCTAMVHCVTSPEAALTCPCWGRGWTCCRGARRSPGRCTAGAACGRPSGACPP